MDNNSRREGDVVMVSSKVKSASKQMVPGTIVQLTQTGVLVLDKAGYLHKVDFYEICAYQNLDVDST